MLPPYRASWIALLDSIMLSGSPGLAGGQGVHGDPQGLESNLIALPSWDRGSPGERPVWAEELCVCFVLFVAACRHIFQVFVHQHVVVLHLQHASFGFTF